ncbi:MAG: 4Fe-4S dicluster domain-containing protein [Smithella sp.]|jgi:Fe-S-cluster-containing dehydrogenase component|nr:4Fe-4S dicluster domain-containing protein [Smithella sp.]
MKSPLKSQISRRSFIQITAGAAALTGLALPKVATAASDTSLSTLIDLSLCDGCADREIPACVSACKSINKDKIPPVADPIPEPWPRKTIEDWSKKQSVTDRLTPYNFIYVQKVEISEDDAKKTVFIPRRCMHCDNPPCATICPFSANHKKANSAVVINQNQCFGGAKCKDVCPWEIPQRQSGVGIYLHVLPGFMGNGVMYKCDLCHDRLVQGRAPGCIEACPRQALLIGPKKAIEEEARHRAAKMNGYIYGKDENGGTATLYVSPVSFEKLDAAMVKKPGQPDMKTSVQRRMQSTDPLGKAVLASPLLGVAAAGVLGWFSKRKEQLKKGEKDNV